MLTKDYHVPKLGTILIDKDTGIKFEVVSQPRHPFGCTLRIRPIENIVEELKYIVVDLENLNEQYLEV